MIPTCMCILVILKNKFSKLLKILERVTVFQEEQAFIIHLKKKEEKKKKTNKKL